MAEPTSLIDFIPQLRAAGMQVPYHRLHMMAVNGEIPGAYRHNGRWFIGSSVEAVVAAIGDDQAA